MVAGVRITAVKDSSVSLRMSLDKVPESYLPTRRTLCYQRQKEWGILQKYCFRQKREETQRRLAEGVSCQGLTEAGYSTSKGWRRSMKNLKKLETWTPQDGEGSVWFRTEVWNQSWHRIHAWHAGKDGWKGTWDERKGNWVIVLLSKYSPLRGTGQRVKF